MNRQRQVYGYELMYREASPRGWNEASSQSASARLLTDAITAIGLDVLTDGKRAFIRIDRATLLSGIPATLPTDRVVFEFDTDVTPDADILTACQDLKQQGFALAINAHPRADVTASLLPFADYLKIDGSDPATTRELLDTLLGSTPYRVTPIAKQIETPAHFTHAVENGFDYFQGFFFGQPVIKEGRAIPAPQMARLTLVQALQDPNLSVDGIEALMKPDTALCYRTLRTVNAAGMAHRSTVKSIREALILVGREPIRRWATLLAFAESGRGASTELLALSAIRARFCEVLAEQRGGSVDPAEAFLVGLCSLLDAILNRPMPDILSELPFPENVRLALLGEVNPLQQLLECATAYGSGEWDRAAELARLANVDPTSLPKVYVQSLRWARELRSSDSGA